MSSRQYYDRYGESGVALAPEKDAAEVGRKFIGALVRRDFEALEGLLSPTMRMRALLPKGPLEFDNSADTVAKFKMWFAFREYFEVVETEIDDVADRLGMRWRLCVDFPEEPSPRLVEQVAYAKVEDGRIVVLDLLCTGFRPLAVEISVPA